MKIQNFLPGNPPAGTAITVNVPGQPGKFSLILGIRWVTTIALPVVVQPIISINETDFTGIPFVCGGSPVPVGSPTFQTHAMIGFTSYAVTAAVPNAVGVIALPVYLIDNGFTLFLSHTNLAAGDTLTAARCSVAFGEFDELVALANARR